MSGIILMQFCGVICILSTLAFQIIIVATRTMRRRIRIND